MTPKINCRIFMIFPLFSCCGSFGTFLEDMFVCVFVCVCVCVCMPDDYSRTNDAIQIFFSSIDASLGDLELISFWEQLS